MESFLIIIDKKLRILNVLWSEPVYLVSKQNVSLYTLFKDMDNNRLKEVMLHEEEQDDIFQRSVKLTLTGLNKEISLYFAQMEDSILVLGLSEDYRKSILESNAKKIINNLMKTINKYSSSISINNKETISTHFENINLINNELINTKRLLEKANIELQASGLGRVYFRPDGKILSYNSKALEIIGIAVKSFGGKSIFNVVSQTNADLFMKRIKSATSSEEPQEYIDEYKEKNSSKWYSSIYSRVSDENGEALGVQLTVQNITEKRNLEIEKDLLESHLRNQQKLESIGTLASGVAHEINNPINGILNYGQIILDSDIEDKSIKEYAREIISETERVSNIVKNLLEFSRQNKEEHSYAKIDDIISKTLSLVNTVFKHDQIILNLDIEDNIPQIKCNSQQIQQVIMNLITNARDALNEKYPEYNENKKINLRCKKYMIGGKNWVRIIIEDFGKGISKDNIDKIFDPFFTTKGRTEGTGLGLSISYGIVKEHNGEMTVESKEGQSTKFEVDLPCEK